MTFSSFSCCRRRTTLSQERSRARFISQSSQSTIMAGPSMASEQYVPSLDEIAEFRAAQAMRERRPGTEEQLPGMVELLSLEEKSRHAHEKWTLGQQQMQTARTSGPAAEEEALNTLAGAILLDEKGCIVDQRKRPLMTELAEKRMRDLPLQASVVLGYMSMLSQDFGMARDHFQRAYDRKKQHLATSTGASSHNGVIDADPTSHIPFSRVCCMLGTMHSCSQSFAVALKFLQEATENTEDKQEKCCYMLFIASCLRQLGRPSEAREICRKHLEEVLETVRASPHGCKAREHLCETAYGLAQLELELNSVDMCISTWRVAEELYSTLGERGKAECKMHRCGLEMELKMRNIRPEAAGSAGVGGDSGSKSCTVSAFQPGDVVEVLPPRKYQGERGVVADAAQQNAAAAGRTVVLLGKSSTSSDASGIDVTVAFKTEALKKIFCQAEDAAQQAQLAEDAEHVLICGPLFVGDRIILDGLQNRPDLNGRVGVIKEEISSSVPRYTVDVAPGSVQQAAPLVLKFLPKNLRRAPPSTSMADSDECAICLGSLQHAVSLSRCGHTFCRECIAAAAAANLQQLVEERCPLCRRAISEGERGALSAFAAARRGATPSAYLSEYFAQQVTGVQNPAAVDAAYQHDYQKMRDQQRKAFRAAHEARATAYVIDSHERSREQRGLDTVGMEDDGSDDPVVRSACDVAANKLDIYGDGDQSSLGGGPGCPAWALQQYWAAGGTLDVLGPRIKSYSAVFRAAAWGDHRELSAILDSYGTVFGDGDEKSGAIEDGGNSEKMRAIELRHSSVRFSALHVCVFGNKLMEAVNGMDYSLMIISQLGGSLKRCSGGGIY